MNLIPGFPDYWATEDGEIWSAPRARTKGGILKGGVTRGYRHVSIYKNGRQWTGRVHTLVALAFLGPRPEGLQIRHLNGDESDNRPGNLAYGTGSENELDKVAHGMHPMARKTHCPAGHPLDGRRRDGKRYCLTCNRNRRRKENDL